MSTRHLALIALLAIALFCVDMFVNSVFNEQVVTVVVLSVCLVVASTFALWRSQKWRAVVGVRKPRVWEVAMASVGIAYCVVVPAVFVTLPFFGYAAFDPIVIRWVPVLFIGVAAAIYPVARKWLR